MPGTGTPTDPARTTSRWRALRTRLLTWLHDRDWDEGATLMVVGALIGLVGGLGVVAFYGLIDLSYLVLNSWPERHVPWLWPRGATGRAHGHRRLAGVVRRATRPGRPRGRTFPTCSSRSPSATA